MNIVQFYHFITLAFVKANQTTGGNDPLPLIHHSSLPPTLTPAACLYVRNDSTKIERRSARAEQRVLTFDLNRDITSIA